MNVLKEAAIFVGDHVTAPIRKLNFEIMSGRPSRILRLTVWSDKGELSQSHFEWVIIPKGATKAEEKTIIDSHFNSKLPV
jgi:hypothetical protein